MGKLFKLFILNSQAGALPLLLLLGVIGLAIFLMLGSIVPFFKKDLSQIFPKPPSQAASPSFFYGVFEDANHIGDFGTMMQDIKNHNLDTVVFTNNNTFDYPEHPTDEAFLTQADQAGINVLFAPHWELDRDRFYATVPEDLATIRQTVYPIADKLKDHPSLLGYSVIDDARDEYAKKLQYVIQAFKERDPDHPASPVYVGGHDGVYNAARSSTFLTYEYPAKAINQPCNWSSGARYVWANNITQFIDQVTRFKDPAVPVWFIGQVHGSTKIVDPEAESTDLREPTVEEVRRQHWEAIGAGIRGMSWFIYGTQEWWTGLVDNPPLYNEISDLGRRITPHKTLLGQLSRVDNHFTVSSEAVLPIYNQPQVTSLRDSANNRYAVVVNSSCSAQNLKISGQGFTGQLKDIETNQTIGFNTPVNFRGGDGKLFQLINNSAIPNLPAPVNLLNNPSFETNNNGFPNGWGRITGGSWDNTVAHSGNASLKVTGPVNTYSDQQLTLKPNTQYSVSFWAKSQNVTEGGVDIRMVQTLPIVEIKGSGNINGTTDWKRVSETFYTSTSFQAGRIDLEFFVNSGGTVWIDDLQLCEGKQCFYLNPQATPLPTPTIAPLPTPTKTPSPTPTPGSFTAPQVSFVGSCVSSSSSFNVSWINPSGSPVSYVDISDNFSFSSWYNKSVASGTTSTTGPGGFSHHTSPTTPLTLNPNTQYFVRLWNGVHSPSSSFTTPNRCATPTAIPTPVRLQGDTDNNGVVDLFDYNNVLRDYDKVGPGLLGDTDKDNDCDLFDYNNVLRDYGKSI